jgi:hypothetical protein
MTKVYKRPHTTSNKKKNNRLPRVLYPCRCSDILTRSCDEAVGVIFTAVISICFEVILHVVTNENLFRTKNYIFNLGIKFMSIFLTTAISFHLVVNVTNIYVNNRLAFPPKMSECLQTDMKEFMRPCTEVVLSICHCQAENLCQNKCLVS